MTLFAPLQNTRKFALASGLALLLSSAPTWAGTLLDLPLQTSKIATPLTMIVAGRDHRLFYEAYNDASDIDGDGELDLRFKPSITYLGLFDSTVCYEYSSNLFKPKSDAGPLGKCSGLWSGNWLNYVTTSRIDALRVVLYGGHREVDTATQTILRRAYIPQDAHSWAKEYTSETVDGYKIGDYTPLASPGNGKRHFFGNATLNYSTNCSTLNTCSNLNPMLSVITNSSKRVWEWASTERPVLDGNAGGARTNYAVRAEVCTANFNKGCKRYPDGNYKPVGLLHDYGENDAMLFGLLTGSYDQNQSGGRLRKEITSFKDEVTSSNGTFTSITTSTSTSGGYSIVRTFNNLRIREFNNGRTDGSYKAWGSGWLAEKAPVSGEFPDWGNPIGEMMYEAVRYFAGKGKASSTYWGSSRGVDTAVNLPAKEAWTAPYTATNYCARGNLLVVSDLNISYDSDELPGSRFGSFSGNDLAGLDVGTGATTITNGEPGVPGLRFIGQNESLNDSAPSAKTVTDLGKIRGLAPEEPTKQGSYYAASVAHYAKKTDLTAFEGKQTLDTFAVALASPLPRIAAKLPNGKTITLVPFAKTVALNHTQKIDRAKGKYQPTDQIVDFYVEEIANSGTLDRDPSINAGRYYAKFRINFEDVEQGADHDMDAIVEYTVKANADNTLTVTTKVAFNAEGWDQRLGYVISGTEKDGIYLEVQNRADNNLGYFLNTPPGRDPGYCDNYNASTGKPDDCDNLPYPGAPAPLGDTATRTFKPASSNAAATLLNDPLWYAAKWGGFVDRNESTTPDQTTEWDADGDGVPDTYFFVQNPTKLKEALQKSFDNIVARSASSGNITSNGQEIRGGDRVFQPSFSSANWSGELMAKSSSNITQVLWRASEKLPVHGSRKIFTWKDSSTTKGTEFLWSNLSADAQTLLGNTDVLNYLRGDQSKEGTYRKREKLLGDIVHSSPYYLKDQNLVFVGANDGMLHAFDAATGAEVFAYIPGLIFDKLKSLSDPKYAHTFLVDGEIAVSSKTQTPGKNYLIAALGRGAKGLFGLDVSTPGSFTGSHVLWERSATGDNDMGHILGRPQIGKTPDGNVVAIFGNGYNSVNNSATLYVVKLDDGSVLKKITVDTGDNGLATPTLVDSDGNGTIDRVYAGDLKGNVWKFNLSNASAANWALSSTTPLFVAKDASNNRQPITAKILVTSNTLKDDPNIGKTFLLFGTGSYYFQNDPGDKSVQTWYGIIDDGSSITNRTGLMPRTITHLGTVNGMEVRAFTKATPKDMENKKGWYIDLKDPNARGERIVTTSQLILANEPALLASSIIPNADDPCNPTGTGFLNAVNAFTGGALTDYFFDFNSDGKFDGSDKLNDLPIGSFNPNIGMPGEGVIVGDKLIIGGSTGEMKEVKLKIGTKKTGRISWREIRLNK